MTNYSLAAAPTRHMLRLGGPLTLDAQGRLQDLVANSRLACRDNATVLVPIW